MPRKPRSEEEVGAIKQKILDEALILISKEGYDNFSMRKLGQRLGIAAKTIYNYYASKDEIYLYVLKSGFDQLYEEMSKKISAINDPFEKLCELKNTYIHFGVNKSNYYDIMFTLYVPKRDDYIGTDLDFLAGLELNSALRVGKLFIKTIEEISEFYGDIKKSDANIQFIQLWTSLHGIVATYNNNLLGYLHENDLEVLETIAERHILTFKPQNYKQNNSKHIGSP